MAQACVLVFILFSNGDVLMGIRLGRLGVVRLTLCGAFINGYDVLQIGPIYLH